MRKVLARLSHDPSVEGGHEVESFCRRDEFRRLHELAVLVAHAQQQFELAEGLGPGPDRHDRLAIQLQAVFLARAIDAGNPLHLAQPVGRVTVVVRVHAVAARFLRRVARHVGGAHDRRQCFGIAAHLGEADRDADVHDPVLPDEPEIADRLAQALGDALRHVEAAIEQQHAEFVAAEPGEGVGRADAGLQDARYLLQQAVAGLVATGVVDHLELVEVQVQHDVANLAIGARGLQGLVDAMFEFAAIDQAR